MDMTTRILAEPKRKNGDNMCITGGKWDQGWSSNKANGKTGKRGQRASRIDPKAPENEEKRLMARLKMSEEETALVLSKMSRLGRTK